VLPAVNSFLGLLQKATGAQMIFWQTPPSRLDLRISTFFATYYYHGNAGAFLNLVWPLSAGLVIRAFSNRRRSGMRAICTIILIVTVAGVLANTSRTAQVVALLLVFVICVQFGPAISNLIGGRKSVAMRRSRDCFGNGCLAQSTHLEQPLNRWQSEAKDCIDARWRACM